MFSCCLVSIFLLKMQNVHIFITFNHVIFYHTLPFNGDTYRQVLNDLGLLQNLYLWEGKSPKSRTDSLLILDWLCIHFAVHLNISLRNYTVLYFALMVTEVLNVVVSLNFQIYVSQKNSTKNCSAGRTI